MEQNRPQEAVVVLHEALAIHPQDSIATELLNKALEETALMDGAAEDEAEDLADFEQHLERRKLEASHKLNGKRTGRSTMDKGKGRLGRRRTMLIDDEDEREETGMDMTDDNDDEA